MKIYKIGGGTVNQTPMDWSGNTARLKQLLKQARSEKLDILVLPELCVTGYGCEDLFLSQWLPEKAMNLLPELIKETSGLFTTFNLPVRHQGVLYNCSAVVHDQKLLGIYAKQFMALDGVHYEPRWFHPWPIGKVENFSFGDLSCEIGDLTFELGPWHIGIEICEDAWRGQVRPAYRLAERGVNLIINPSASHFAMQKTKERIELVENSSEAFHCTYVYANLLGNEAGRMIYDGEIMIAHHGKLCLRNELLSFQPFQLSWFELNPDTNIPDQDKKVAQVATKQEEFPQACALALFDYLRKSKTKGFTLSLSGGADSATCAIMVAEMVRRGVADLGQQLFLAALDRSDLIDQDQKTIIGALFYTAYQATSNSSLTTRNAAETLAKSLGAQFYEWNIDDQVKANTKTIETALGRQMTWETDDLALQNIQSRSRSPIIWMLTNVTGTLLLTTSNRSEGDVGYATMDGDTSGSLAPIASVDKPFIKEWLKYAEHQLGYDGLSAINILAPTAELRPGTSEQTDEDDLMPYPIMVAIEREAIREHRSPLEVYQILVKKKLTTDDELKTHIRKFFQLWSRNQWKRERLAPAFHLDDFNIDPRTWCRFPILSAGFVEELEAL